MSKRAIAPRDQPHPDRYERPEPSHGHEGMAHAIAQMLREGRAAIDLPLSALHRAETRAVIRILRMREDPRLRVIYQWPVDSAAELS